MTGAAACLGSAGAFALILGLAVRVLRRRFTVVTILGQSMMPTYEHGDRVLVQRTAEFGVGDVIVFAMPPDRQVDGMKWLVKRVTAVAGDVVPADIRPVVGAGRVPAGRLVVHGDGSRSLDSRQL